MGYHDIIKLNGDSLTLAQAELIAGGARVKIDPDAVEGIVKSRKAIEAIIHKGKPVYGINTGFGYFANKSISDEMLLKLQDNIIQSHASGYGKALSIPETRLAMALRLNVLVKGLTGVRLELCQALSDHINYGIYPLIPEYGSVGASGDLCPLAHLALPLTGRGMVSYEGNEIPATEALKITGIAPITLAEKEGLGLINGTQVMLAIGTLALAGALRLRTLVDLVAALSYEAMVAHVSALDPRLHEVRGQLGQISSAAAIRSYLKGSYLYDSETRRIKVQDPYSLRCAPQIHGASHEAISYAEQVILRELNAATDNPLIFSDEEAISGGNFHGQPLAMAFDFLSIALSEYGNVSERRLNLLLDPHHSGLSAFLAAQEGIESGYMASQYLAASLVSESKLLANPACTDSIPGNVGIEDHVSMGMASARKLRQIVDNVKVIIAVEAMAAAQAIDLRGVKKLGKSTQHFYDILRSCVPTLSSDRIIAKDVQGAVQALEEYTRRT